MRRAHALTGQQPRMDARARARPSAPAQPGAAAALEQPGDAGWADRLRTLGAGVSRYGVLVAAVLAWQVASQTGLVSSRLLPSPTHVAWAVVQWATSGHLVGDVLASIARVLAGFAIATAAAGALGIGFAIWPPLRRQLQVIVELLRPIPPIAWIPLAILWFGIGNGASVFIVSMGAFFPILSGVYTAVTSVKSTQIDAARCLGAGTRLLVTDVLVPASLPTILSSLRTGLGVAWMSLIAAELVGAQAGVGYMLQLNRIMLNTDSVLGGMVVIGCVGMSMHGLLVAVERRVSVWNQDVFRASL